MDETHTITLRATDLDGFRHMLREQMAGDHELMRNLLEWHDHPDAWRVPEVAERVAMVDRLADAVGGLF
jgi:hypothetical protein